MALYFQKHKRINHMFRPAFVDKKLIDYVNGAKYIQNSLDNKNVKPSLVGMLS